MDEDRIPGTDEKITGSVKEAIGKLTGDAGLQAEGHADKAAGAAQSARNGTGAPARNASGG